jgi:16S rRNA (uracil1498-N3)-methyltransferase
MHRFFVPPEVVSQAAVRITGGLVHQIHRVLRLSPGEQIVLLDNSGWEYRVDLRQVTEKAVTGEVVGRSVKANEPRTKITLYQSVLKGNRFEWALQKGTELGVSEFVPVIASRCILQNLADAEAKFPRWQRVILEAAEQSERAKFPALLPALMFNAACERAGAGRGLSLIPWEEETAFSLKWMLRPNGANGANGAFGGERPFSVSLFIGPEGGFTTEEISVAEDYGIRPVTLGPRIMRAETAAIVAAAAVFYELGDLGK